jgi:Rod binding domain-containing protein
MTPVEMTTPFAQTTPTAAPKKVEDAARQFEALLVTQLIRAARDEGGWLGSGGDGSGAPALEFAEEQLAAAISARGGLGLAQLISTSLTSVAPHTPRRD